MQADDGKSKKRPTLWIKVKLASSCGGHCFRQSKAPSSSPDEDVLTEKRIKQPGSKRRPHRQALSSRLSTASSNRSYYTACEPTASELLDSRSSRIDETTLAELDELGDEADAQRRSSRRPSEGLSRLQTGLPAVIETEGSPQPNGSAHLPGDESGEAVHTSMLSAERQEFLHAYDAGLLKMLNKLHGTEATCIADVPLLAVAPWNQRSGYLGHLSEPQQQALNQMRRWFPESRRWHTDHDILRFLRAREFDLQKTKALYMIYIDDYRGSCLTSPSPVIRDSEGPFDMELFKLFPPRDTHVSAQMQKLKDYFLHTVIFHLDKEGRPVVYFKPAHIVKNNMNRFVDLKYRIAFQSAANEGILHLMKMASEKVGYHVENSTQILDLSGMSALSMMSHMRSEESQAEWQHNMDFQPEVLHKIYIINAPTGMSAVWKLASLFVPAATRSKVEVFGGNYFSTLESVIGKENMPSCYGGSIPFEWHEHRSTKELK